MNNTLFQMPNEENNFYRKTLDDFISTKNELTKTKFILNQKEMDYKKLLLTLQNMEIKFKNLSQEKEKINNILNEKLEENKNLENKIIILKQQNESFNEKYKKEFEFNSIKNNVEDLYKSKIKDEVEKTYNEKQKQKDLEINDLNDKLKESKKKYDE